jgi:hypothetical protein
VNDTLAPGSVSVVIASPREPALAHACLRSVLPQAQALGAPVILARAGDAAAVAAGLGERDRDVPETVTIVPVDAPPGASLPEIRGAGLAAARTPYAALIEDHCVAAPGWLEALCASAAATSAAFVGGRMGNAQTAGAVDWAAYFAEYGFFMGTARAGGTPLATGANVLYGPRALPLAAGWARDGLWEDVIHARLAAAGCDLTVTPAAVMLQNQRYAVGAFCLDRYRHGLAYARVRLREQQGAGRWMRALTAPLLPVLLASRLRANVRPDERAAFRRALPLTLMFLSAWSAGEMMGYVRGRAS